MQVLITHGRMARCRVLQLGALQLVLAAAALVVGLMALSGAIYHFPESVTPLRQACLLFAESAISMAEVFVRPLEMTARGAFAGPLAGNRRVREPFSSNPGTNGRADPRQGWPLALVSTG